MPKRTYFIDIGDMPREKSEEYLKKLMAEHEGTYIAVRGEGTRVEFEPVDQARAIALELAVKSLKSLGGVGIDVVAVAKRYYDFLEGKDV
jgi:hypothetical protein